MDAFPITNYFPWHSRSEWLAKFPSLRSRHNVNEKFVFDSVEHLRTTIYNIDFFLCSIPLEKSLLLFEGSHLLAWRSLLELRKTQLKWSLNPAPKSFPYNLLRKFPKELSLIY